jgi:hypothetical protein
MGMRPSGCDSIFRWRLSFWCLRRLHAQISGSIGCLCNCRLAPACTLDDDAPMPTEPATTSVTREELYEQMWAEPATAVAARYGVSSSFLARVCTRMGVPRPPRGYWAMIEAGKKPKKTPLPDPRRGTEMTWSRDGGRHDFFHVLPQLAAPSGRAMRRRSSKLPTMHPLLVVAQPYLDEATITDAGYARPTKRMLVDVFVSKAALERTRDTVNQLFTALERRGYDVVLAPKHEYLHRLPHAMREGGSDPFWGIDTWKPDRPTVTYVNTVAIGLTIFEMTEDVPVRYLDGVCVREAGLTPAERKRSVERTETQWMRKRDMPTRRLCLRAFSPYPAATWEGKWAEKTAGQLVGWIPRILRELEAGATAIVPQLAEARRLAEIEHAKRAAEHAVWLAGQPERDRRRPSASAWRRSREGRKSPSRVASSWEQSCKAGQRRRRKCSSWTRWPSPRKDCRRRNGRSSWNA